MLQSYAARAESGQTLRHALMLVCDAIATAFGLFAALLLAFRGDIPPDVAMQARVAAPLLVVLRVVTVGASGLHRSSVHIAERWAAARLVAAMFAASLVFAAATRSLPASVYVHEFYLTTSLMIALRLVVLRTELPPLVRADVLFASVERSRRVLNVAVAAVGLVLSIPVLLLIALAIKCTSRGAVVYSQERVGVDRRRTGQVDHDPRRKHDLGGRPFTMYKFRTMTVDAERGTGAVWSAENDPRVTAVGRVLRHCRLDELPQLVNVLKGDMNIVGPRPERPAIFAELRTKIPHYALRQRVRPGITGFAQVNLEYDATLEDVMEKVRYDLEFISRHGVGLDWSIMARTIPVMLFRKRMLARERRGRNARAPEPARVPRPPWAPELRVVPPWVEAHGVNADPAPSQPRTGA